MVAADFLQDPQVRQWLDGVEPAWTLLTFDSLRALRQDPSAGQTAIQIATDLSADEIAGSAVMRNTLILLHNGTGLAQLNGSTVATYSNNDVNFNTTNVSGTIT